MDSAATALGKMFKPAATSADETTTATSNDSSAPAAADSVQAETKVETEIAPAVEHTHVKKEHETREQKVIEKERHQDHFHTTVQPLEDTEVVPEKHEHEQETRRREVNNDDGAAQAQAEADRSGFTSTTEESRSESKTTEPTQSAEHVHHHVHETIQPVIEKEVIVPSVTHKLIDVKEKIQDPSENHGVSVNPTISVDEFQGKLDGDKKTVVVEGKAV